jgi:predicted DCC family thiol-disulfide oxidoreductase YuxK
MKYTVIYDGNCNLCVTFTQLLEKFDQGKIFVVIATYRTIPGLKSFGDRTYVQIRDNRYPWFGKRETTYHSAYPIGCHISGNCAED